MLARAEARLRAAGAWLARPRVAPWAAACIVLLALVVRAPMVFASTEINTGHGDANIYYNYARHLYLDGNLAPDPHRASGWPLLLAGTMKLFGVHAGPWVEMSDALDADAARAARIDYALCAALAGLAVAAVWFAGREFLPPLATLAAMLLVAFDPFLLGNSATGMSEAPYVTLVVLAFATTLRARRHPAWLLATGALMALAAMLRVNGLVLLVALLAFAAVLLRGASWRRARPWLAGALLVSAALLAPYLAWRAASLPGPFDYGTNQRFWADDLWDMHDAYWTHYSPATGGPRETMGDYFARHSLADAAVRLYQSVAWQAFDLVGAGHWPPLQKEGGDWVGTAREGAALTPLLVVLGVAGLALAWRRELLVLPFVLAATFATFVWIYPLVRSVRYLSPLIPLVALAAGAGWLALASGRKWGALTSVGIFAAYVALYDAGPLVRLPGALVALATTPEVLALLGLAAVAGCAMTLAPWRRAKPATDADDQRVRA